MFSEKSRTSQKSHVQIYLVKLLIGHIASEAITNVSNLIIPAAASLYVLQRHCSVSFKHRTLFDWNSNKLKGVRFKIDLTKKRYNCLRSARSIANENQDINYVIADINCRLKVVFKNGTSDFFKNIIELNELIEKYMC